MPIISHLYQSTQTLLIFWKLGQLKISGVCYVSTCIGMDGQLNQKIRACVKKVDLNVVQELIKGVNIKLRKIEDHGSLSLYKKSN